VKDLVVSTEDYEDYAIIRQFHDAVLLAIPDRVVDNYIAAKKNA
jgi:hypothetical protein